MRRRIFIAINLPEDIKKMLCQYQQEWADLPVRFIKKNSLHLTILFIGYVDDERMLDVCHKVREMAKKHKSFELSFNKVCLAPPNRPPRLIWLEGEKSEKLAKLKNEIEKALYGDDSKSKPATSLLVNAAQLRNFGVQHNEKKELIPHITLARIRQFDWRKLEEKPQIDKEVFINFSVNSKENPLRFLFKPIFFTQSVTSGVAGLLESFAYSFAPASIILAAKRAAAVFWSVAAGGIYFKEQHILIKAVCLVLLVAGIILLVV